VRSPAVAIVWELGRRHRWGLAAVACYLLGLAAYRLLILEPGQPVGFDDSRSFAFAVMVPIGITFMYFLGVFSHSSGGDLAARESVYPTRMFTLPLTNTALAGWPMLCGTVAMALLWLVAHLFAVWPSGFEPPLIWPAVLAAAVLAWTQALTWMPYAVPGARVIVILLLQVTLLVVVVLALHYEASQTVMVALLAPHLPVAFAVARRAVARARRGDVPDGRWFVGWPARIRGLVSRAPGPFPSAVHAQVWFERKRYGSSLPTLVGLLLPFELLMLFAFSETPSVVRATLLGVLLTPPFMATFVAATVSRSSAEGRDLYELTPFMATRPVTSAALVSAKLRVAIRSTLATWLLVLVAIPVGLRLSGTSWVVLDDARRAVEMFGSPRAIAMAGLGVFSLVLWTWKRLVQSLFLGMSGRAWLVKGSVFVTLTLVTLFFVLAPWMLRRQVVAELLAALPWILGVPALCKVAVAGWVAVRLHASRLVSDRTLILGVLFWDVAVLALFGLLLWLVPPLLYRVYGLAVVAILVIPLARVSAAPLALSWNRHR
jgi:hypothetical protein